MEEIKAMLLKEKEKLIEEILKNQNQTISEHEIGDEIDIHNSCKHVKRNTLDIVSEYTIVDWRK